MEFDREVIEVDINDVDMNKVGWCIMCYGVFVMILVVKGWCN